MTIRIFGWLGGGIALIYNIPQLYRNFKRKTCDDISQTSLFLRVVSYVLYIIHGWLIEDPPLLWMTLGGMIQIIIIWIQIIMYHGKCQKTEIVIMPTAVITQTSTDPIETADV